MSDWKIIAQWQCLGLVHKLCYSHLIFMLRLMLKVNTFPTLKIVLWLKKIFMKNDRNGGKDCLSCVVAVGGCIDVGLAKI